MRYPFGIGGSVHIHDIVRLLTFAEPLICLATLVILKLKRLASDYSFVSWYLAVHLVSQSFAIWLLSTPAFYLGVQLRYHLYFWTYWTSYALEVVLGFGIIYSTYQLAMAPLPGLQRLGMVMFRWAAGISIAVALAMAFGPRVTGGDLLIRFLGQLAQTQSVLTLCLLLFVCVTVSPMGLSVRSKIFGVCLGFGVTAATQLVSSAWLTSTHALYSLFSVLNGSALCLGLGIWTVYFALPDPKRRLIVLPTTSPFLRWNQISAVLGDAPGYVALGTVTEDMFAPAEVEIMRRASAKMSEAYGD